MKKIIEKTILDRRPDSHLNGGPQFLGRFRQDMGAVMAQDFQGFIRLPGDDLQVRILLHRQAQIGQDTVNAGNDCRLQQAGANVCGDLFRRHRANRHRRSSSI